MTLLAADTNVNITVLDSLLVLLLGMLVIFFVLTILIFVVKGYVGFFALISGNKTEKKAEKKVEKKVEQVVPVVAPVANETSDEETVAAIMAAIPKIGHIIHILSLLLYRTNQILSSTYLPRGKRQSTFLSVLHCSFPWQAPEAPTHKNSQSLWFRCFPENCRQWRSTV